MTVVEEYSAQNFSNKFAQALEKSLEGGRSVGEAKGHSKPFKESIGGHKGGNHPIGILASVETFFDQRGKRPFECAR